MAKLAYNEITPKRIIRFNDEPFEVLTSHVFRKQQRKPVNQTKLRHLVTGKVIENSFHSSETAEEADVETKPIVYIYTNNGESWFHPKDSKKDRFSLPYDTVAEKVQWLVEGMEAEALVVDGETLTIRIPVKVELEVVDAPPAVRGNTAQGGTKIATLKSGVTVSVPLFINEGDILRINTESGEYTERVDKAT